MASIRGARRKVGRLLRQPTWVLVWLGTVWLLLGVARAIILAVPFNRFVRYLGASSGITPQTPVLDPQQRIRAQQVGIVITMAARYTPWDSNCFPQGIVACLLLRLYQVPYSICFGLGRKADDAVLIAHAWVTAGQVPVVGSLGAQRFTTVGVFVSPPNLR